MRVSPKEVRLLRIHCRENGIKMDPDKIQAVLAGQRTKTVKEVQAFLGFANFYRQIHRRLLQSSQTTHELTKKEQMFEWTKEAQEAFEDLKARFTSTYPGHL